MEASQHILLAACFTLHSINATLAIVLQRGAGLWIREEHRMRVFENRVLRRIFGPKRDEVMGDWRKLHNKKLITCTLCQV
jgi:PAS domain-containing protein